MAVAQLHIVTGAIMLFVKRASAVAKRDRVKKRSLAALVELIEANDAQRWPLGTVSGGRG